MIKPKTFLQVQILIQTIIDFTSAAQISLSPVQGGNVWPLFRLAALC